MNVTFPEPSVTKIQDGVLGHEPGSRQLEPCQVAGTGDVCCQLAGAGAGALAGCDVPAVGFVCDVRPADVDAGHGVTAAAAGAGRGGAGSHRGCELVVAAVG
jgi:hypothetical protein